MEKTKSPLGQVVEVAKYRGTSSGLAIGIVLITYALLPNQDVMLFAGIFLLSDYICNLFLVWLKQKGVVYDESVGGNVTDITGSVG